MNLYNIGGEGQLYLGMIGGAWAGLALGDRLPSFVMIPTVLLLGALAGALWILIPAYVRSRLGTSEIVTTLLLTLPFVVDVDNDAEFCSSRRTL